MHTDTYTIYVYGPRPTGNNEAIIGCYGRPLGRAKFTLTLAKSCLVRRLNALRGGIQIRKVKCVQMNALRSAWAA